MYTALNLAIAKIANPKAANPSVRGVWFYPDKTMATDSYRLIEVTAPEGLEGEANVIEPVCLPAREVERIKANEHALIEIENKTATITTGANQTKLAILDASAILYDALFTNKEPAAKIVLNAKYLKELCAILEKANDANRITISVYSETEPIKLEAKGAQNIRALLMPIRP